MQIMQVEEMKSAKDETWKAKHCVEGLIFELLNTKCKSCKSKKLSQQMTKHGNQNIASKVWIVNSQRQKYLWRRIYRIKLLKSSQNNSCGCYKKKWAHWLWHQSNMSNMILGTSHLDSKQLLKHQKATFHVVWFTK